MVTRYVGAWPEDGLRSVPMEDGRIRVVREQKYCTAPADGGGECRNPAIADGLCVLHRQRRGATERPDLPVATTREMVRSRRKRVVRAKVESMQRLTKTALDLGRDLFPEPSPGLPATRGECVEGPRPCPMVSCKFHLYLDVNGETGSIKRNFPDLEVWEMAESCALDVADRGGDTLEKVGELTNLTRERIRQVEVRALAKVRPGMEDARDEADEDDAPRVGRRHLPIVDELPRIDLLDVASGFDVGSARLEDLVDQREGGGPDL